MLEFLAVAPYAALLVYAAGSDVARLIIPNWVSIAMAAAFTPAALLLGMPWGEIGIHFLVGAGALAVGFFLFHGNIIGGGDAKLIAATALWTGVAAFLPFAFWTAAAGGLMALAVLGARQLASPAESYPSFVNRLLEPKGGVPYAVAIMAGGLMAIPEILAPLTLP